MFEVTFFGGVNEIGGNMVLLNVDELRVLLDFGMSFSRRNAFYEEFLQVRTSTYLRDSIIMGLVPPLDGLYRDDLVRPRRIEMIDVYRKHRELWDAGVVPWIQSDERIDALLLSHAHLDHSQYIPLMDPAIPVYCSKDTRTILEVMEHLSSGITSEFTTAKIREVGYVKKGINAGAPRIVHVEIVERDIRPFDLQASFSIEDLEVRTYPVDHSIPGATAYIISTPNAILAYTGDYRFHGTHPEWTASFFEALEEMEVDVIITEGTRIDKLVQDSESRVIREAVDNVSKCRGLVMVGYAWKDITRMETMLSVAKQTGRDLVISPRTAFLMHRMGRPIGDLDDLSVYLPRRESMLYSPADYSKSKYLAGYSMNWKENGVDLTHLENGIRAYDISNRPENYILHLDFHSFNEIIDLGRLAGSLYIRAQSEPFTEEMMLTEERMSNWFSFWGINEPDHRPVQIHASGHASGPEILQSLERCRPRLIIPIHTGNPYEFKGLWRTLIPVPGKTYDLDEVLR